MFYEYSQNNSGGSFDLSDDIGVYVWIEAPNQEVANAIALTKGIYFNSMELGYDCGCCGDRWYSRWGGGGGCETLDEYVSSHREGPFRRQWDGNRIGVAHYMDGRREDVWYDTDTLDAHEVKELESESTVPFWYSSGDD